MYLHYINFMFIVNADEYAHSFLCLRESKSACIEVLREKLLQVIKDLQITKIHNTRARAKGCQKSQKVVL